MKIRKQLLILNVVVLILALFLISVSFVSLDHVFRELDIQRKAGELVRHLVNFNVVTEDVLNYGYTRTWQQWDAEYNKLVEILSERDIFPEPVVEQFKQLLPKFTELNELSQDSIDQESDELFERLSSHIRLIIRGIIYDAFRIYDNSTLEVGRLLNIWIKLLTGCWFLQATIIILLSVIISRRFSLTFGLLIKGAEKIISGDLTVSLNLNNGTKNKVVNDEISELALAFNTMTSKLTRTLEELEMEIEERKITELNLEKTLDERAVLIQELYHRTKNNMQVILSMMSLKVMQADNEEFKQSFNDIQAKIFSMSLVHEKLYQSKNFHSIELVEYFTELTSYLSESFSISGTPIEIEFHINHVVVPMETAIPCGMTVSELIINCFKHASEAGKNLFIKLTLNKLEDGKIRIVISDNGPGLPAGFDLSNTTSLGLITVKNLIESQLGGSLNFTSGREGLIWTMDFPYIW